MIAKRQRLPSTVAFERRLFRLMVNHERRLNGQPDTFTTLFRRRLYAMARRRDLLN